MFKVILLAKKRAELSDDEFRSYYSEQHVPMMNKLLEHGAAIHRRNFVIHNETEDRGDYDVITEVFYEDRAKAEATFRKMADPEKRRLRIKDEERFLDTSSVQLFVVESETSQFRPLEFDLD